MLFTHRQHNKEGGIGLIRIQIGGKREYEERGAEKILEQLCYKQLRELGLSSLEKRRLQGGLNEAFQCLKETIRKMRTVFLQGLLTRVMV